MAKRKKTPDDGDQGPTTEGLVTVPVTRAATVTDYYANHVGITISPWDITLRFGRIIPASGVTEPRIEEGLLVYMSPQHAKACLVVLTQQVQAYENMFGPIALPARDKAGVIDG